MKLRHNERMGRIGSIWPRIWARSGLGVGKSGTIWYDLRLSLYGYGLPHLGLDLVWYDLPYEFQQICRMSRKLWKFYKSIQILYLDV